MKPKRRNLKRWQEARLRRLMVDANRGTATPRQLVRIAELEATLAISA